MGAGAAGAAIGGAVGGPVGAPIGAVIGTVIGGLGGGLAGKGIAEAINPTEEDAYWQSNFRNASYFQNDYEFADYAPAYKVGYEGYRQSAMSGRKYADMEPDMQRDFEQTKGTSRLDWEKAKAASRECLGPGEGESHERPESNRYKSGAASKPRRKPGPPVVVERATTPEAFLYLEAGRLPGKGFTGRLHDTAG